MVGFFEQPSYFRGGGRSGVVDGQPPQRAVDGVRDHRIQRVGTGRIGVHVGVGASDAKRAYRGEHRTRPADKTINTRSAVLLRTTTTQLDTRPCLAGVHGNAGFADVGSVLLAAAAITVVFVPITMMLYWRHR